MDTLDKGGRGAVFCFYDRGEIRILKRGVGKTGTGFISIGRNRKAVLASQTGYSLYGNCTDLFIEEDRERRVLRHGDIINVCGTRVSFFECEELEDNLVAVELYGFLTSSPEAIRMLHHLNLASRSDEPLLITGESGCGKELLARAAHKLSHRRKGNFTAVNCGAIPEGIFESEFFGHEKGAFTGAGNFKKGLIETAHNGTIFLDEIGELSLSEQTKLLRLIETGEYYRVGAVERRTVNARFIAATNRNLTATDDPVAARFRRDLLHRLLCHHIVVPPLRRRREDILLIAKRLVAESGKDLLLSDSALNKLLSHGFEGNVRELRNTISRALLLNSRGEIQGEDITFADECSFNSIAASSNAVCEPSLKDYIEAIIREKLKEHSNSRKAVYKSLKIPRSTFYSYLKRMNIT